MKIRTVAALAIGALAMLALPSLADQTLVFSAHSWSKSTATTTGKYSLKVTMSDYQNQVAGVKTGKTLVVKIESPMQACTATDFTGTPEKEFRKFSASGCQVIDNGNTVVFKNSGGDFVLAHVQGSGNARHVVVRSADGKVIWERSGSNAFFTHAGGFNCKATVTDSARPAYEQSFVGRCYPFIGREIALGVVMENGSDAEVIIDVTDH